ncbi:LOW QUALITY PROTEIN: uncharacterized protein LOC113416787 [Notechis scutatus]|uniref:LOW QUALITY PROTEIN: uncharacterized protein LOC113416787 n=1 Tax=Notechis scutatus TaxID=8663 RepID=A0A6J1USK5_9SAUR|nr:LOW QUALITY PROTEIN: uncharacterized protein LOC113416787 [Notechis scutatus]
MEYLSQKVQHLSVADTVHEISVPFTPITCYGKKMPYSADNNNSIQSRSCSLNFTTNSKMGFDEPSKTVNGNKHSTIWKLSEVTSLRNEETARATAGLLERKCLRNKCISKLDNELHRERSIPEIQKLKDVNWTELFLDQSSIGDSHQSVLDHCIFKKMVQNNRGKDKKPDTFDPKLLHANIFNSSVAFVNNSENFEQETPGTLVNNNTSRPANIISDSIQAAKYNNENYFWAPLSDSSDEEWTNRTKNNLKWPTMDSKNYKNLGDSANFDNPTIMKYFSSPMLEEEFVFKIMPGSCEKWNPGIETLQIQEYKCKNFTQTPKYEDFSGTQNSIKSNHEESKNGNINFLSKFTVQEDMLRDQMSDIQPLERASDQRNESKLQQMLEMDKIFKGRKYIGEQDVNFKKATYQKDTELTSPLDYPLEIKSSSVSSLLKPSENNTYKEGSDSLNPSPKGTNKSNGDCVLLVGPSQISDDQVIHKPCIISKNEQGAINDNISATGLKPADGAKEFPTATIKWDGHEKSFCSKDFSHSDGVLAKYYFYLNYLNESKRFRCENAHQFFFCQEHDFFKEAYYDTGPCYCKNGSMYEEQTDENMNHDLGTSEGKERTEIIKQQNHFKDQMLKPQFANSTPKQMERTGSFKDQEVFESRKSSPKQASPKKHWERANISCSSYTQRELKPRSQCVRRPATGKKLMRKNNYNSQNQTSSGTQCRLQYENASQDYNKLNMKSDCSLTPWLLLPDELWLCIFSLLTHKDISRISQVCRHFYQLAGDKFLWKKIQLKDCHCLNNDWLISLGKHHPECFTLDHCHDKDHRISEVGLKQFFQYCEGYLKELSIKNCSGSGYKGDRILLHASTFCYNLAVVDISWTGTTDFGLDALVKGSRSLQSFSANGCQITNESVMALIGKHGKSLKKLEMFGCQAITDKCLKSISTKCLGLEVLNIGRVHRISQDCLVQTVNSLQKLTSLNVTGLEMMRDSLVHYIVKCPKLDCLVLNSCAHITDISLIEISRDLPGIRYLDVNGCKDVSDIGVQALARNCHKLSYLDLSSTATSKRGVCLLANFCFNTLKCLKLSFCRNISLDAVVKLCKNCKRLQILHLYGCRFIPDLESITKVNKTVKIFHDLTCNCEVVT